MVMVVVSLDIQESHEVFDRRLKAMTFTKALSTQLDVAMICAPDSLQFLDHGFRTSTSFRAIPIQARFKLNPLGAISRCVICDENEY
jgi:hypothetical protein